VPGVAYWGIIISTGAVAKAVTDLNVHGPMLDLPDRVRLEAAAKP
jgi:hypothetical protein